MFFTFLIKQENVSNEKTGSPGDGEETECKEEQNKPDSDKQEEGCGE